MGSIKSLQKKIEMIQQRNKAVEMNKAWKT